MMKKNWIPLACIAAVVGLQHQAKAVLVYDFETLSSTGNMANGHPNSPAMGPDGFFNNAASLTTVAQSTTGATQGMYALELGSSASQTFGGAESANVPAALEAATSVQLDLTVPAQSDPGYGNLELTYFTTDGALNPDRALNPTPGVSPGIDFPDAANPGMTVATQETVTIANLYLDPDGVLTGPSTPAQILAADTAFDLANGFAPDAINGVQFDEEHGGNSAFTIYLDNVQVPPITAAPEPASLSALILGGGALIARRRKA